MPACAEAVSKNWCIEEVRIYSAQGGAPVKAEFVRSVGGNKTLAIPDRKIPAGGTASLWRGASGSGFENLSLMAYARAEMRKLQFPSSSSGSFQTVDFTLQAVPYVLDSSKRLPSEEFRPVPDKPGVGHYPFPIPGCAWQDVSGCGSRVDFPDGIRIGVTLRSEIPIAEFFNGRLSKPELKVDSKDGITTLSIDAEPVNVPEVAASYDEESVGLRKKLGIASGKGMATTRAYYPNAFEAISLLRTAVGDKASGENTSWRLSSMGVPETNFCYKNKGVAGMVFTNATVYDANPPAFAGGSLGYKVAGFHYLSDGKTLFEGTYDLLLRSDVARCIYRFSSAPISATVQVVGAAGEQKVATTSVSEKDGWLKLGAYGFTFSENKIVATLTQASTGNSSSTGLSPKPATQTLSGFKPRSAALSNQQRSELSRFVVSLQYARAITCTGYFSSPSGRSLAVQRARATCDLATKMNSGLKATALAALSKPKADTVTISIK
jgi:hypothetical protein